jgi:hypothetical protein
MEKVKIVLQINRNAAFAPFFLIAEVALQVLTTLAIERL